MKHLKKFNESVNIDKYKEDIEGILIELKDKGFKFDIEYEDINNSRITYKGFSISIFNYDQPSVEDYGKFKLTDVEEYLKTLDAYFKVYFKINRIYYKIRTEGDNRNTILYTLNDYINSDYLKYIQMVISIEDK